MDWIRIKNLRSLADTGSVRLRPITILLGRNSSGKSTFLRTFPLLRQSVESRTSGPILWYGRYVDFGDFEDAVRVEASPPVISLEFQFELPYDLLSRLSRVRTRPSQPREDIETSITIELVEDKQEGSTRAHRCKVTLADHVIELQFDHENRVVQFCVNSLDVLDLGANFAAYPYTQLVPVIREQVTPAKDANSFKGERAFRGEGRVRPALIDELKPLFHANTKESTIRNVASKLGIGSSEDMLAHMNRLYTDNVTWRRRVADLSLEDRHFEKIKDLQLAVMVPRLLDLIDDYMGEFASGITYIAPLRAIAERYYRPQDLSVEEVDFQGANLPMFLRNLTDLERKSFSDWTEEHLGFAITATSSGGHISLLVRESDSGNRYNVADVGFGLSQILPIAAQLWALSRSAKRRSRRSAATFGLRGSTFSYAPKLFAIEQPELHLHPGLQTKVTDLMLATISAAQNAEQDLKLIIETHSETVINHLGHRIASNEVDPNDVQVVVFEQEQPDLTKVRLVEYDIEGFLTNWPFGFFEPDQYQLYES